MLKKDADDYKIESRDKFNKQASNYDTGYDGKHARGVYDNVLLKLHQFRFNKLLDVGCGTGNLLSRIRLEYDDVEIAGVDLSPDMLEIARKKLGDKVNLRVGDSEDLPFPDDNFDMIICTDSFHHYPHPDNVLNEFRRVLKPKGGLIIADPYAPRIFRQLINLYFSHSKGGDVKIYSEAEISKLLVNTGLKSIKWELTGKNSFIVTASN